MIGKTISHYKILEKIGEGGMGVVYKARDTRLGRVVALKFLPAGLTYDDEAKARFVHEARAASALDHPNIATVYEIGEAEGLSFISMAYVEGKTLAALMAGRTLTIDEALNLAVQIAEGLCEAHGKDIVHRDIKPENIMVTSRNVPKIMDFGLAKLSGASRLTEAGTTIGTMAYMSPEQIQGGEADQRSDIFSFGVVLYEMITGRLPFEGDHEAAMMYSIVNARERPVRTLREDAPAELEEIVGRALEKDATRRYQGMSELLADLEKLKAKVVTKGEAPERASSGRRVAPFLIALVVAVGLTVGIKIQIGRQPPAAAAENVLAVMYFENLADPEDSGRLGDIVTNLLIADLSESQYVRVLSTQRLHDILKQLGKEGEKVIDRDVASRVAERARAKWMLLGSIPQVDPHTVLVGQLIDVPSGTVVGSQRLTGEEGEDVFSLVDRLTVEVKGDLSLPAASRNEQDRPVADATTHSEEAYRRFLEGEDLIAKFYAPDAIQSFQKAVELDSTMAMAYSYMGLIGTMNGDERARGWIARAKRHSDKVGEKDKLFIEYVEANFLRDYPRVIEIGERAIRKWPDEKEAYFVMARAYQYGLEKPEKAIEYLLKGIEIDPLYKTAYNQLAYAYNDIGEYEKSIWAVNKYISVAPDEANPYDSRGGLYALNGKLDPAIESYGKALEIKPDLYSTVASLGALYIFKRDYAAAAAEFGKLFSSSDKNVRSQGRRLLALIPLNQGKLKETMRTLDEGIAADEMEGVAGQANAQKHFQKAFIYNEWADPQSALREFEIWTGILQRVRPLDAVRGRHIYVRFLAEDGMVDEAEGVAGQLKRDIERLEPVRIGLYWSALSFIERAKGNRRAAASHMRAAMETRSWRDFPGLYFMGRSSLEDGNLGEAVEYLEAAASRYSNLRARLGVWSAKVHYLLGQAYEGSGWTEEAAAQYEEFLEIWKDADQGLFEVGDAKRRVASLREKT